MQTGKLIMNKGLPRSGKSTWAREFVKASGNAVIVSKDELRKMLHNGKWSHRNEKLTMSSQLAIVKDMLSKGMTVIVDDTNLSKHHYDRWYNTAKEMNAGFEVHHEKETDFRVLIQRDRLSAEPRGEHVILRLALENNLVHFPDMSVVVCDLDGTLCDISHRRHYVTNSKKDWAGFFSEMSNDGLYDDVAEQLQRHQAMGKTIIFVSARPEKYRAVTEDWLHRKGFRLEHEDTSGCTESTYFALLMRPDNDTRDDVLIKQEILDRQLKKEWIYKVYDDRPAVIRMWRENGLDVEDCGNGIDF